MFKSSSTTIIWNGKDIPEDYLKKVLSFHNRGFGVAIPSEGNVLQVLRQPNIGVEIFGFKKVLEKLASSEKDVLFVLQGEAKTEDEQGPFNILLNADGKPVLVAALDGDFSALAQETKLAPEIFAVEKIKLKAEKVYKLVGGDLVKLMDELLEDEFFGQGLLSLMGGERGSITLMAGDGENFVFRDQEDKTFADTSYGFVSNTFEKQEQVPQEKPKSLEEDILSALGSSKSDSKAEAGAGGRPKTQAAETSQVHTLGGDGKVIQPRADVAGDLRPAGGNSGGTRPSITSPQPPQQVTGSSLPEFMELPIPASVMNEVKKKKVWLEHRIPGGGPLPPNWESKDFKVLQVARSTKNIPKKFMADFGTHISAQKGLKAVAETVMPKTETAPAPKVDQPKPTSVPAQPAKPVAVGGRPQIGGRPAIAGTGPQPDVKPKVEQGYPAKEAAPQPKTTDTPTPSEGIVEGPIPVIPPNQLKALRERVDSPTFKTAVDRHGQAISDPTKFSEIEKKFPNLAHLLGKKSLDEINWGYPEMYKIAKEIGPEAIVILAFNRHFELKKTEQLVHELLEENEKLKKAATSAQSSSGNSGRPRIGGRAA